MKRVEIKLENRHLNFAAQLSFTRETTLRFALSFFFYFFVEGFAFLFHCIFFYFSRNSWSFSFSPILINFSSKIFKRFLQLKYFMRNISKLINIFRTSVSDLMTGTKSESFLCHDIYFYIFLSELCIERNLFLKLILYFHMAHFISGEKLTSLHCSKNEVEEIFVSQVDIKKLFSSIVPLWSFIFFLRENIFLFGKKICIFLKISYISIFFTK